MTLLRHIVDRYLRDQRELVVVDALCAILNESPVLAALWINHITKFARPPRAELPHDLYFVVEPGTDGLIPTLRGLNVHGDPVLVLVPLFWGPLPEQQVRVSLQALAPDAEAMVLFGTFLTRYLTLWHDDLLEQMHQYNGYNGTVLELWDVGPGPHVASFPAPVQPSPTEPYFRWDGDSTRYHFMVLGTWDWLLYEGFKDNNFTREALREWAPRIWIEPPEQRDRLRAVAQQVWDVCRMQESDAFEPFHLPAPTTLAEQRMQTDSQRLREAVHRLLEANILEPVPVSRRYKPPMVGYAAYLRRFSCTLVMNPALQQDAVPTPFWLIVLIGGKWQVSLQHTKLEPLNSLTPPRVFWHQKDESTHRAQITLFVPAAADHATAVTILVRQVQAISTLMGRHLSREAIRRHSSRRPTT